MNRIKYLFILMMTIFTLSSCEEVMKQIDSDRCQATTQNGTRCQNKSTSHSKYCRTHQNKRSTSSKKNNKCKATTQNGKRCSREAKRGGYCTQHYNQKH